MQLMQFSTKYFPLTLSRRPAQFVTVILPTVCTFWATTGVLSARDDSNDQRNPLPQVIRDWEKRRLDFCVVTYRLSGTRTWPENAFSEWARSFSYLKLNTNNPPNDVTGVVSFAGTLDFRNDRCRIENDEEEYDPASRSLDRLRMLVVGAAGICSKHILMRTGEKKVDFVVTRGLKQPELILARPHNLPLLFASGVVPVKLQRPREINFAVQLKPEAFVFEGYVEQQGKKLAVLRVDDYENTSYRATNHYWVDLERDSAVVKFTSQLGTAIVADLEIEYVSVGGGWLPAKWTRNYSVEGVKRLVETIRVEEARQHDDLPADLFVLSPTANMRVREYEYTRSKESNEMLVMEHDYTMDASSNKSQVSSRLQNSQFPQLRSKADPAAKVLRLVRIALLFSTLLLPACVLVLYLRKSRPKSAR